MKETMVSKTVRLFTGAMSVWCVPALAPRAHHGHAGPDVDQPVDDGFIDKATVDKCVGATFWDVQGTAVELPKHALEKTCW